MLPDQKCRADAMPCATIKVRVCLLPATPPRIAASLAYALGRVPALVQSKLLHPKLLVRCTCDFFSLDAGSVAHALENSALVVKI